MPVTDRTMMDTLLMRREVDRYLATVDNDLYRMWRTAWNEIGNEFAQAARELIDIGDGEWPLRSQVLRAQRAQNALKASVDAMRAMVPGSETVVRSQLRDLLSSAEHWTQQITRTQLPAHGVSTAWSRADAQAIDNIVKRTTQRVHALSQPLTAEMERNMKAVLIRGVMVGDNPTAAARQLLGRCLQVFDGGRARAANIARTELLDAHRAAARQSRWANKDVVKGWKWHATLSARTCPSCLAQHGSEHSNREPGPHDHQQGRCTAIPLTKTWRELGIDQDEPGDDFPNGQAWFNRQPRDVKLRIMGPERLRRLESGELSWDQLSMRVQTPGWRDSYQVAPLRPLGQQAPKGPTGFDPTPFRNAQTIPDVLAQLEKSIAGRGRLLGTDGSVKWELDRVKDVSQTVAELFHRFPEVKCDVEFAKMSSKVLARAQGYNTRTEQFQFTRMALQINRGKMSARSTLLDNWGRDVAGGYYNVRKVEDVAAMQWVARHEFGHILDFTSANMHGGRLNRMNLRVIKQNEAFNRGMDPISPEMGAWVRGQAGKYARSDDAEMLAEAFADVETYGPKAHDLSKAIVAELMKYLGRTA